MARLSVGADASGVVHLFTYEYGGKLTNIPLCWVMRKLPLFRLERRGKNVVPTCLWCVALRDRR